MKNIAGRQNIERLSARRFHSIKGSRDLLNSRRYDKLKARYLRARAASCKTSSLLIPLFCISKRRHWPIRHCFDQDVLSFAVRRAREDVVSTKNNKNVGAGSLCEVVVFKSRATF